MAAELSLASAALGEAVNALLQQDRSRAERIDKLVAPAAFAPRVRNTDLGIRGFLGRQHSSPGVSTLSELRRLRGSTARVIAATRTFILNLHVPPPDAYNTALAEWAEQAPLAAQAVAEQIADASRRDVESRVASLDTISKRLLDALSGADDKDRSLRNTTLLLAIALELKDVASTLEQLVALTQSNQDTVAGIQVETAS